MLPAGIPIAAPSEILANSQFTGALTNTKYHVSKSVEISVPTITAMIGRCDTYELSCDTRLTELSTTAKPPEVVRFSSGANYLALFWPLARGGIAGECGSVHGVDS